MDPFKTPVRVTPSFPFTDNLTAIPKSTIISMIENIPFKEIFLPKSLVYDDDPKSTSPFIKALGQALIETMISKSLPKTSPKKLLASRHSAYKFSPVQLETLTKPHVKETSMDGTDQSERLDPMGSEPWNPFKGLTADEIRTEMLKSISVEKSERRKFTDGTGTLIWIDSKEPPLPSILPFKLQPADEPTRSPPEVDAKRMEVLKEIDLDKNPYYLTRLERQLDEAHPRVYIRGKVIIPKDDRGHMPVEFGQEEYKANGLALLDYWADCCIICADFLGVELERRVPVFFNFKYIDFSCLFLRILEYLESKESKSRPSPKSCQDLHYLIKRRTQYYNRSTGYFDTIIL
jgi:hypothetical protein